MAGLQEKTTYRLALFLTSSGRTKNARQKKVTRGAINKIVREMTDWTWLDLTLGTPTSAFTKPSLYGRDPSSLCDEDAKRSKRNFR